MSSRPPPGPPPPPRSANGKHTASHDALNTPLVPTFTNGIIYHVLDAFIILQACLDGRLNHVPRRPTDKERDHAIASGNIYCYEENASGIRRWTDGVTWSPSRILSNCLVYRELTGDFPQGEKKKALKRHRTRNGINRPGNSQTSRPGAAQLYQAVQSLNGNQNAGSGDTINDPRRLYLGSLLDSYPFKEGGLVKKTISFNVRGVTHHIVSYYTLDDAQSGRLEQPSSPTGYGRFPLNWPLLYDQTLRVSWDQEMCSIENNQQNGLLCPYRGYHPPTLPPGMQPYPGYPGFHPQAVPTPNGYLQGEANQHLMQQHQYEEENQTHQHQFPLPQPQPQQPQPQQFLNDPHQGQYPLNDPSRHQPHQYGHLMLPTAQNFHVNDPFTTMGYDHNVNGLPTLEEGGYEGVSGDRNIRGPVSWGQDHGHQ